MLELSGESFREFRITKYNQDLWFKGYKFAYGFNFPNVPALIKGDDLRITETIAILKHLARAHKPEMLGKDIKDQARVD